MTSKVMDATILSASLDEITSIDLIKVCNRQYNITTTSDVEQEITQDFPALVGMRHLGMKLHSVGVTRFIPDGGIGNIGRRGQPDKSFRQFLDHIAVTHPRLTRRSYPFQQDVLPVDLQRCPSVFAAGRLRQCAAHLMDNQLPGRLNAIFG